MSRMKVCPNGHRYDASLPECPYCPKSSGGAGSTKVDGGGGGAGATLVDGGGGGGETLIDGGDAKTLLDSEGAVGGAGGGNPRATMIMSAPDEESDEPRDVEQRKLVGWLSCFTWEPFGKSYEIREGKTYVGTSPEQNIVIDDPEMSREHAQFLFRGGKLRLKDNFSTNGSFVNGEDIEDDPRILADGDEIQMGKTVFRLRFV